MIERGEALFKGMSSIAVAVREDEEEKEMEFDNESSKRQPIIDDYSDEGESLSNRHNGLTPESANLNIPGIEFHQVRAPPAQPKFNRLI